MVVMVGVVVGGLMRQPEIQLVSQRQLKLSLLSEVLNMYKLYNASDYNCIRLVCLLWELEGAGRRGRVKTQLNVTTFKLISPVLYLSHIKIYDMCDCVREIL